MDHRDKLLLKAHNSELEFQEDVTQFQCIRCGKLAIDHFMCDCNYIFCDICTQIYVDELCPKCRRPISSLNETDPSFEEELSEMIACCPNKKNGCKTMYPLIEIPGHLKRCRHVTPMMSTPSVSEKANYPTNREGMLSRGESSGGWRETDHLLRNSAHNPQSQPKDIEMLRNLLVSFGDLMTPPRTINHTVTPMDATQSKIMSQGQRSSRKMPNSVPIQSQNFKADPGQEYNVLLMGQIGVGKSTFINALANYLRSRSLDGAEKKTPIALIPTQFSIPDETNEQRTVHCGSDPNENMDIKGQSATQSCKAYEFPSRSFLLRIIDTPGIGDDRGIGQDHKNVQRILRFLSVYTDLHAICIMLKPNEPTLTPLFAFTIKQLLSRLHTNANNNIVFIFTNSRNTFYRPGDVATPLKTLLDKIHSTPSHPKIPFGMNNIFCLDNEAFRFLVAFHNGVGFSAEDRSNFSQSWDKSVEESKRLVDYIVMGCNGHELIAPHNVNLAGDAVVDLSKPLLVISMNMNSDVQVRFKKDIEYWEGNEDKCRTLPSKPVSAGSNMSQLLRSKAGIRQATKETVEKLEAEIKKYETEQKIFTNSTSKLAVFLKYNLMILCRDALKAFLNDLIADELSLSKSWASNPEIIKTLNRVLDNYEILKDILEKIFRNQNFREGHLRIKDVEDIIKTISTIKISSFFFNKVLKAHSKVYESRSEISTGTNCAPRLYSTLIQTIFW